ncbi:hypothetical protein M422DRAFT_59764 [Sphaerobolus stellatus SS14]|uniref:AP complex subunit sigma n=1 Tax=Sphaerobolus stellatus (strain SS14) TaxID=990650 RepID=A0A0C9W390_SPHS4|nr:hypothetical protein M422DRAFT_59764 [Sphaerobolus stellatus SS14]
MIHAVLIFNNVGLPRLTKFYTPFEVSTQELLRKIFSLVCSRPAGLCNFIDAPDLLEMLGQKGDGEQVRVVYRNYATLYFVFVVDGAESELGVLDLIQVFVESLDKSFENVCELDLVFHFDEVHHILGEVVQGGLVLETNVDEIAAAVQEKARGRKASAGVGNGLSLGGPVLQTPLGWLTERITGVSAR